jgi:hypothetical protein
MPLYLFIVRTGGKWKGEHLTRPKRINFEIQSNFSYTDPLVISPTNFLFYYLLLL